MRIKSNLLRINRSFLNKEQQEMYDVLFDAICEEREIVSFRTKTPVEKLDLRFISSAVMMDCPLTYYIDPLNPFGFYRSKDGIEIELKYSYTSDDRRTLRRMMDKEISRITGLCMESCRTDLDKELFIHDHLANTIHYTHDTVVNDKSEYSAAGAILDRRAVCMGISKATCVLLNAVGVECGCMTNEEHMWNVVRIDGKTYNLDVTWDLKNGTTCHDYFNVDDVTIMRDHPHDSGPICNSMEHNWYKITDRELRSSEELFSMIGSAIREKEFLVDFRMEGFSYKDIDLFLNDAMSMFGCGFSITANPPLRVYHLELIY